MKRVVIDTSVLIRAFLRKTGNDWKVYEGFLRGEIEFYYSQELVDEFLKAIDYPRVRKRIIIENDSVRAFLGAVFEEGKLKVPKKVNICRDIKDNYVLGLAMKAKRKDERAYLITADEDLLVLKGKIKGIEIMTANEFIRISA